MHLRRIKQTAISLQGIWSYRVSLSNSKYKVFKTWLMPSSQQLPVFMMFSKSTRQIQWKLKPNFNVLVGIENKRPATTKGNWNVQIKKRNLLLPHGLNYLPHNALNQGFCQKTELASLIWYLFIFFVKSPVEHLISSEMLIREVARELKMSDRNKTKQNKKEIKDKKVNFRPWILSIRCPQLTDMLTSSELISRWPSKGKWKRSTLGGIKKDLSTCQVKHAPLGQFKVVPRGLHWISLEL